MIFGSEEIPYQAVDSCFVHIKILFSLDFYSLYEYTDE